MSASNPADAAFERFEALVRAIAGAVPGGLIDRGEAMRWSDARALLLDGGYRDVLPGFVIQCGSVFKFREFIALYDPEPERRLAFVDRALAPARARHAEREELPLDPPAARRATSDWLF